MIVPSTSRLVGFGIDCPSDCTYTIQNRFSKNTRSRDGAQVSIILVAECKASTRHHQTLRQFYKTRPNWQDKTRQDKKARRDKTRREKTRQDETRHDTTRQAKRGQDKTRHGKARQDKTRQDKTWKHRIWHATTRQDATSPATKTTVKTTRAAATHQYQHQHQHQH